MSNIIEFYRRITPSDIPASGVTTLDGDTSLGTPLQLPMSSIPKLQVCAITISDRIPNVFNGYPYYEFNNTLLRVWTNVPGSQFDISLERGLYNTVDQVADAINAAIVAHGPWYTSPLQPALDMVANAVTDTVLITIDTTKLAAPHTSLTLDFRKTSTGTDLATTLGFSQGSALLVGPPGVVTVFASNQEVKMDTQGTTCDLQCSLISMRRRNNDFVRTLAIIPFAGKSTISDNVWPPAGQISPMLVYEGSKSIKYLKVEVKTMDGRPMLFMSGAVHVIMSFSY